jgi:hypothetical protein
MASPRADTGQEQSSRYSQGPGELVRAPGPAAMPDRHVVTLSY